MVIIFVFVPIAYTALLFASDAEINMSVTIFFGYVLLNCCYTVYEYSY